MNRIPIALLACATALAIGAPAAAADQSADAERALAEAQAIFGATNVPQPLAAGGSGTREATLVLRDLAAGLDQLNRADRRAAKKILRRPNSNKDQDFFGPEAAASPLCDANFCVHWGTKGSAKPPGADADADNLPDFVERTLEAGQQSFAIENTSLGWPEPISDGTSGARKGVGKADQTDVYLTGLPRGLFGYATTEPGSKGRKQAAYLVIDNDYKGFSGVPVNLMRATMAHEYNHILQFAIDVRQDAWMFESTATYMEDKVFPSVNDYLNFQPPFSQNPYSPMAEDDRRAFKLYGSAVWNHWLAGRYGDDAVLDAWKASPSVEPEDFAVAAYQRAIRDSGGAGFSQEFAEFAAGTAEWNAGSDFPDAAAYGDMKRSGSVGAKARKFRLSHTAYRLMRVKPKAGTVKLKLRVNDKTRSGIALVGRIGPRVGGTVESKVKYLPKGGRAMVSLPDAGRFDRLTAVVINADGRVRGNSRFYKHDGVKYAAKLG